MNASISSRSRFGLVCCLLGLLPVAARSDDRVRRTARTDDRGRAAAPAAKLDESNVVVAHLRPSAVVGTGEVLIGDVAMLEGGDAKLRSRIGQLDVADSPRPGQPMQISREQIVYRLQLAGFEEPQLQVRGGRSVSVSMQMTEVSEKVIVEAARNVLLEKLGKNRDDFSIQLALPVRGPIRVSGTSTAIQLVARVLPARSLIGRVQVQVAVRSNDTPQLEVPVAFDVQIFQDVAVARRRIDRGQPLTRDSFTIERQPVDGTVDVLGESANLVGAKTKRTILPTQLITSADVELGGGGVGDNPVLVRQRDTVRMVVQSGALRATTSGEALQDGRAGEMIRVKNVDSQKIVLGRVVDHLVVEIRL